MHKNFYIFLVAIMSVCTLSAAEKELIITPDTLGIHPWQNTTPIVDIHDIAHWSVNFEAGIDMNTIDFQSTTGLAVPYSTRVRPQCGAMFEYDFSPIFGVAAAYSYGNYGARYTNLDHWDYVMYAHMHNVQAFFTMDIMDAFVKLRHSTFFSAYFLFGGGAGFFNGSYLKDDQICSIREDGKYSSTGVISVGLLCDFNLSRTTSLGLKGLFSIYTSDIMNPQFGGPVDYMDYFSVCFRWKVNGLQHNHVRNMTRSEWSQNTGKPLKSNRDTVVVKDTIVIMHVDTVYSVVQETVEPNLEEDSLSNIDESPQVEQNDSASLTIDSDEDGVPDHLDHCPNTPAEAKGMVDQFGCPLDTDHDGVFDYLDECPNTLEEGRYAVDEKGCLKDTDGDGVPDYKDQCPSVVGVASNNGCPEVKKEVRNLLKKALQGIQFETGKSTIVASSYPLLNQIANAFIDEPSWRVEVQGHTDNVGSIETNQRLSEERANAVRDFLIKAGVPEQQLIAHGYGPSMPIADNSTADGRAKNRRVEFVITFEEITYETVSGTTIPSSADIK